MKILILTLMFLSTCVFADCDKSGPNNCETMSVMDETYGQSFSNDIAFDNMEPRLNRALESMVQFAIYKLNRTHHMAMADQLTNEWKKIRRLSVMAIGDHEPLSAWLDKWYHTLEFVLGHEVMVATRLIDIDYFNHTLKVVFGCKTVENDEHNNLTEPDFAAHFEKLMGITAYWGSFFACVGFTWGTGFLFCSPIAWGAELLLEDIIAPRFSNGLYKRDCL